MKDPKKGHSFDNHPYVFSFLCPIGIPKGPCTQIVWAHSIYYLGTWTLRECNANHLESGFWQDKKSTVIGIGLLRPTRAGS